MSSQDATYRFGPYELRTRSRELFKQGTRLKVRPQPFLVLQALAESHGSVVTREELKRLLWPAETFVDFEHGLNTAVKELRGVLNDSANEPRYIETLPRLGYRILVPVNVAGGKTEAVEASLPLPTNPLTELPKLAESVLTRVVRRSWRFALVVVAISLFVGVLARYLSHSSKALPLKEKDTIVLADFQNITGEQVFEDALKQGLTVALGQSPYFQVLSDRKTALILKQMGRSPDERLTGQPAIELCQRAGSKVMVQGSITSVGTKYLIGLTALRCDNSDLIVQEQVQAKGKEEIIRALGIASARLRSQLGESLRSIEKYNAPLEQVTTSSLEALREYGKAYSTFGRGEPRAAIPLFQRAIEFDPGFAMAYGQLASVYQDLGETELAHQNAAKALQLKERLTGSERIVIEAWYNIFVSGNLEKAAQLYETVLQNYPATPGVLNDLGSAYINLGRYEKATSLYRQALIIVPADIVRGNLATALLATEHSDEAHTVLAEIDQHESQEPWMLQLRYWEAFHENNNKEMQALLSEASGVPGARSLLLPEQARTEAYFGRFGKARQLSELAADLKMHGGEKESAADCVAEMAVGEAEVGDVSQARRTALHSLQLARSQAVVTLAAVVMARIGDFKQARTFVEDLNQKYPSDTLIQKYWLPIVRARIELRQESWSKALETMSVAEPFEFAAAPALTTSVLYPAYVRGEIYMAAGNGKRAAEEFNKLLDHPGMVLNFPLGALAHLQAGRAYALVGDIPKARIAYEDFFKIWHDADTDIPILKQAKAEYEKLQ